jgi:hypothetical protein
MQVANGKDGVLALWHTGEMGDRMFKRALLALSLLLSVIAAVPAHAKRVALIIANGRYANASSLKNPAADAALIAKSLRQAGFTSVDVKIDLGKSAMERELSLFGQKSEGADVALIYYAGHGIEAGGQNYLIPTDAILQRDRDLEVEATRLDTVMLMSESARMRIVVLDACRNNPFVATMQRTLRNRAVGRGLAAVEPEGETLVVYAAKAGATAADGSGANSPFAEAMAKRLVQPGLEISLLFRSVRDDVLKTTGRTQEPFTYGSLSGNAFYFVEPKGGAVQSVQVATAAPAPANTPASDALYWQGTVSANTERAYRDYLKRFPTGQYVDVARENLQRFMAPAKRPDVIAEPVSPAASSGGTSSLGGLSFGSLASAFSKTNAVQNATSGQNLADRFSFTPNTRQRQQTRATFVSQLGSSNPALESVLNIIMPPTTPFSLVGPEFSKKYGMNVDNLADTFAILLDTMRSVASMDDGDATRQQASAVRNQLATALSADKSITSMAPAQRQQVSDTALMLAIFIQTGYEAAKQNGPAAKQEFSNTVGAMAQATFGMNIKTLKLTNNGFSF